MINTEEKVSKLEHILEEFITQTNYSINQLSAEMSEFKEEMSGFKAEMLEFKNDVNSQNDRMNKRWGELANKMGTVVEDIIAPGAPDALRKKFQIETLDLMVRRKVRDRSGNTDEFDVIILGSDERVYLIEVKSNPGVTHVDEIVRKAEKLKSLLYPGNEIVPVFGALYFPETILKYASKCGVYLIGMKGDYLEILN